ncbi:unnamed protein product [Protopolystoma xenopodis]|uniref:Uncharacterized protein n=1 Tax=Protopolystoma xenopodis TaxID=117903 RepID=A0A448WEB2_9PLAT|nr:unnamed protein product [Protopolystoma xenopodis]
MADSLTSDRSPLLRFAALQLVGEKFAILQPLRPNLPTQCISDPSNFAMTCSNLTGYDATSNETNATNSHHKMLQALLTGCLECLTSLGESVLDTGLAALLNLLRVDPDDFTANLCGQIIPLLVNLFKVCYPTYDYDYFFRHSDLGFFWVHHSPPSAQILLNNPVPIIGPPSHLMMPIHPVVCFISAQNLYLQPHPYLTDPPG